MNYKTQLEYRDYSINGIKITVELNYRTKTISLVEWDPQDETYDPKRWLFAGREAKYMQGWLNILEAMKTVITECKAIMQAANDKECDEFVSNAYNVLKEEDKDA